MKKKRLIIIAAVILSVVAICIVLNILFSNKDYQLIYRDGQYYIRLDERFVEQESLVCLDFPSGTFIFESAEEMVWDILLGRFTEPELEMIGDFARVNCGTDIPITDIPIMDIRQIYEPTYPTAYFNGYRIKWYGYTCTTMLESPEAEIHAYIVPVLEEEDFYDAFRRNVGNLTGGAELDFTTPLIVEEWEIIRKYNDGTRMQTLIYDVKDEYAIRRVIEVNNLSADDAAPEEMYIYVDAGDLHYMVTLTNLPGRPDTDFIKAFQLVNPIF